MIPKKVTKHDPLFDFPIPSIVHRPPAGCLSGCSSNCKALKRARRASGPKKSTKPNSCEVRHQLSEFLLHASSIIFKTHNLPLLRTKLILWGMNLLTKPLLHQLPPPAHPGRRHFLRHLVRGALRRGTCGALQRRRGRRRRRRFLGRAACWSHKSEVQKNIYVTF